MRDIQPQIEAAGACLAVIGSGKPWQAAQFREERGVTFPLLVDPSMASFRAASLKRGLWRTLGFRSVPHALRAFKAGFRQGKTQGDPWQQGGVFVITPEGKTLFEHISEEAGDHASSAAILQALRA